MYWGRGGAGDSDPKDIPPHPLKSLQHPWGPSSTAVGECLRVHVDSLGCVQGWTVEAGSWEMTKGPVDMLWAKAVPKASRFVSRANSEGWVWGCTRALEAGGAGRLGTRLVLWASHQTQAPRLPESWSSVITLIPWVLCRPLFHSCHLSIMSPGRVTD